VAATFAAKMEGSAAERVLQPLNTLAYGITAISSPTTISINIFYMPGWDCDAELSIHYRARRASAESQQRLASSRMAPQKVENTRVSRHATPLSKNETIPSLRITVERPSRVGRERLLEERRDGIDVERRRAVHRTP
jgi:hypothetical protein